MNDAQLHEKLPIGKNEKILAIVRHHWFAYAAVCIFALVATAVIIGVSVLLSSGSRDISGLPNGSSDAIVVVGLIVSILVILFAMIPIYLLKQEALVVTEESIIQMKKPHILANKISQVNLEHVNDVTVNQDALGTIFGYGHLKIETPGEQDDYRFTIISHPQRIAKQIIEAHENYAAALESGRIHSTLGARQPVQGSAWRPENDAWQGGDPYVQQQQPAPQPPSPGPSQQPTSQPPADYPQ